MNENPDQEGTPTSAPNCGSTLLKTPLQDFMPILDLSQFEEQDPETGAFILEQLESLQGLRTVSTYAGLPVQRVGNSIFVERPDGTLAYFVQWADVKYESLPGRHVTQLAVWRASRRSLPGIAAHVFWQHLFPIHHTVVSNGQQTEAGVRFWEYRIWEALEKGLFVFRVNLAEPVVFTRIDSIGKLDELFPVLFGPDETSRQERMVITSLPLG